MTIRKPAIEKIIERYTRESGVRQLEKQLAKILRKAVLAKLRKANVDLSSTGTVMSGDLADFEKAYCILEGNGRISGPADVGAFESAVVNFFGNTVHTGLEDIIKTYVWSETEHEGGLDHVGADHSAGTDDEQLFISKIIHFYCNKN